MAKCKDCGVEIRWAKSPKGKLLPLQRIRTVYSVRSDDQAEKVGDGDELYISHFETCPGAAKFSGRNR